MIGNMCQDPSYSQVGASLRKRILFVKAPQEKVILLCAALERAGEDLLLKTTHYNPDSSKRSFVFEGGIDDWKEDLETLSSIEDSTGIVKEFRNAIVRGTMNEPSVDWIGRVQGPALDPFDALAGLSRTAPSDDDQQEVFSL